MDSMRPSIDAYDDQPADAPGIEPPPAIGTDERRMHVRAYNFWAKLLEGRSFPSIESLDTEQLGDFGPNSVLLDFTSGIENPAIAFVGPAIAQECELDDTIHYIGDVPRRSLLSRLTDHYLQIIANRAPIGFEAEFVNERGATILYRGVLMPFSSDDDTIDFILGVINWKQAAEPALADALSDEMEAAALAAPHARPTVPVWADGPAAPHDAAQDHRVGMDEEAGAADADADQPLVLDTIVHGIDIAPAEATLADWLAQARDSADTASQAHVRGRNALYDALGNAWRFACATDQAPDDYAELLSEAGIAPSDRSPMTPVIKLVFGAHYDKTRVAEYATVLSHAVDERLPPDGLSAYIARHPNGIKGLVRDIRAARRGAKPQRDPMAGVTEALRRAVPLAELTLPYVESDAEFTVLVARRMADGSHAIVGTLADDDAQRDRTLKAVSRSR